MISSSASWPGRIRSSGSVRQRFVDDVQLGQEVVAIGLDVDQAGRELAAARGFVQPPERADLVGRVVVFFELLQQQLRPVVHRHFLRRARLVVDRDVLEERHEA